MPPTQGTKKGALPDGSALAAQFGMAKPFLIVGLLFVAISGVVYRLTPRLMQHIQEMPDEEPAPLPAAECGVTAEEEAEDVIGTGIGRL